MRPKTRRSSFRWDARGIGWAKNLTSAMRTRAPIRLNATSESPALSSDSRRPDSAKFPANFLVIKGFGLNPTLGSKWSGYCCSFQHGPSTRVADHLQPTDPWSVQWSRPGQPCGHLANNAKIFSVDDAYAIRAST